MNKHNADELELGEAHELLIELMSLPSWLREKKVRERRFRRLDLAELLLVQSESVQASCPKMSRELARAAQLVAAQPYAVPTAARLDSILARSLCLQGNACRLLRDLAGAEERFEEVVLYLTGETLSVERAMYCRLLSSLREEQGRLDESMALLWRAVEILRTVKRMG
ncbi:MAG TPA: hypothetical protein VN493_13715 [Thermoanaerobaculia bacterium]|nr:hypothetical protein [Thermoanaerobaculia bacterium]